MRSTSAAPGSSAGTSIILQRSAVESNSARFARTVSSLAAQQARCGYGPRLPFLVVSPYAKKNFVDHTITDQSSVVKFIEENWDLPQLGNGSFDQIAGPIDNMFNWNNQRTEKVILDPTTGQVVGGN